ncbi:uncharacterized protein N7511_007987 [Penicillium nucicola]|uniref:uncharacterized protein n=1 Tax=Penicillium nucicola TaxID=1850975 RepID=UPI00254552EE|nr:uncharacterized protein N7511_007987 [Penicillium nucicola]KAJ5753834.1 hypothetical protein N7511_007987 [Penicillium nucicola]
MAKSVRASVSKRNRANLRKKVFGPLVDARTERLAAKLQELASQPRPDAPQKSRKDSEMDDSADQEETATKASEAGADEEMDLDSKTPKSRSSKSGRVQKQRNRKPRNSIVFQARPSKTKKGPNKK